MTPEGYYNPVTANYYYYLKDHLGNNRVTYHYSGSVPVIDQEVEYYPFGSMFAANNLQNNLYLYNGKELNNEFFENYDYGERFYDPQIGRFTTIDPLSQITNSVTPYHYCLNNPVSNNDPTGMWTETATSYYTNDPNEIAAFFQQMGIGQNNGDPQDKEKKDQKKEEKTKDKEKDQVPWWQRKVGDPKDHEITQKDIDEFWADNQNLAAIMGLVGLLTPVPGDEFGFAFYSGKGAKEAAKASGMKVLSDTKAAERLAKLTANMEYKYGSASWTMWGRLSKALANMVPKGSEIKVFLTEEAKNNMQSIWNVWERPTLEARNVKITIIPVK